MPPKSFSAFPTSAWAKLPTDLSWMKKMYADSLVEELNLDPGILVDVQGACTIQSVAVLDLTFFCSLRPHEPASQRNMPTCEDANRRSCFHHVGS